MESQVELKILTPIWTGGVETGKMDRIHETGIIGSMRWWYEVIVRGLGGYACDPSEGTCIFNAEKYAKSSASDERQRLRDADLCDVCQVFGATGWRRRFRLIVYDAQMRPQPVTHPMRADRLYQNHQGKNITPTWYFQNPPQKGNFLIELQSLSPVFSVELLQGLIQLVLDWTAIGARTQMGFGVTELVST
ncbi:MAG: type III-B CRISPR module RAMP protein Cmr1, partial [Desulfobulbaceae bacterium]|nr:type III-B CRISPR module RAMP protein Cmr1 [Desulfobulbaceae bacterium]